MFSRCIDGTYFTIPSRDFYSPKKMKDQFRTDPTFFHENLKDLDSKTLGTRQLAVLSNKPLMNWARKVLDGEVIVITSSANYAEQIDERIPAQIAVFSDLMKSNDIPIKYMWGFLEHSCEGKDSTGRDCYSEHSITSLLKLPIAKFDELTPEAQDLALKIRYPGALEWLKMDNRVMDMAVQSFEAGLR